MSRSTLVIRGTQRLPRRRLPRPLGLAAALSLAALTACGGGSPGGGMGPDGDSGSISVSVSPTSASVEQGSSTMVTGMVTRSGGFTGTVNLSVTGAPAGVTTSIGNQSTSGSTTTATITIEVGAGVAPGMYSLTVRATGSGVSTVTASFNITVTGVPDFDLGLAPAAVAIDQGDETDVEITIDRTNFNGPVTLTLEGPDPAPPGRAALGPLPAGVTASFSQNPVTGASSTLTLEIDVALAAGLYDLTLRATADGLEDRTATLTLTVNQVGGPAPNIRFEATEIGAGASHACRLDAAGAAFCWGLDHAGQIGDGVGGPPMCGPFPCPSSPVSVTGGLNFSWIVTGGSHSCGLTAAGAAHCWGEDDGGELGNDAAFVNQMAPVPVGGGHTFIGITAGAGTTCGIDHAGAAWCWGSDSSGQLGDGAPNANQPLPVAVAGVHVFGAISAGALTTCALDLAGQAWCWGNDGVGELGDGSPPQNRGFPVAVSGGHTFVWITVGDRHACALDAQGQAYCWGGDNGGQLGNGAGSPDVCGPFPCSADPLPIPGNHVFDEIIAGGDHTCGIDAIGNAYCWGKDDQGQVGNDDALVDQHMPVPVAGGHLFREVALAIWLTCGVDLMGDAYCWGDDSSQQLGNGGAGTGDPNQTTPGKVDDLP